MRKILFTSLSAGALLASSAAFAAPEKGQLSVRAMAGVDFPVAGTFHGGTNAPIADLGAFNPALSGVAGSLAIENRGNRDIFNGSLNAGGELGYGLSGTSEVFGSFRYLRSKASTVQVGNAIVPALDASLATFGDFGRIQSYSGEIGYRQYFTRGTIQPYAAVRAGVTFTDSIDANFRVPDAGIAINNVPFYKNSVSGTVGGDIGVAIPLNKTIELTLETGIRWTSGLRSNDDALSGLGLAGINNAGARWDVPLRGGLTFRF